MKALIKLMLSAAGLLILASATALASSDAGLDVSFQRVRVRFLYSVAVDYGGAEDCIHAPEGLLFDIIALLQASSPNPNSRQEVLQFELYQSSKKPGTFLSLVRDPFEGGDLKELFDGRADKDLTGQTISLLARYLKLPGGKKVNLSRIKLYKCTSKICNDILFGAFPSEEEHSGYCALPDKGCDTTYISVTREEMKKLFSRIE